MIGSDELKKEIQEILDLQAVLAPLVKVPELRCNPLFGELLHRYHATIKTHLAHQDPLYSDLLTHSDKAMNDLATQFLNSTHQLRSVIESILCHLQRCCGVDTSECSIDQFITDAKEIFKLVTQRIKMERERLIPALNQLS